MIDICNDTELNILAIKLQRSTMFGSLKEQAELKEQYDNLLKVRAENGKTAFVYIKGGNFIINNWYVSTVQKSGVKIHLMDLKDKRYAIRLLVRIG